MPVQDDERERELVRMFNLDWDPAHQRAGVDAILDIDVDGRPCRFEVEVKSSTGTTVSTARDVGMDHIQKWRRKLFVIGFYSKEARRPELQHCLCLTPLDMEPWIATIEAKILIDFKLALLASRRLELVDLFEICGNQKTEVDCRSVFGGSGFRSRWSALDITREDARNSQTAIPIYC